jgi:hypothetical protein
MQTNITAVVGASTIFGNKDSSVIGFLAFDTLIVNLLKK